MKNSLAPGIYDNLSFIEYHNDKAVGSSTLKTIIQKSPAHISFRSISSEVANIGTAVHCAILEPEKFADTIICGPSTRRGNAWKDLETECAFNGQTLLVEEDFEEVKRIRDAVYCSKTARSLLENKLAAERSLFWKEKSTGLICKARPDLVTRDNIIVDVKTVANAHPDAFYYDVLKYHYHMQETHYVDGAYATHVDGFEIQSFVFLCVEKKEPYACAVYRLPGDLVKQGFEMRNKALSIYKKCLEADEWPGYPEDIQELKIPA